MVTLTRKKINVFAKCLFTPQKKIKKRHFQKPLFLKKWTIIYNYLLLLLLYIQITKCSYLWLIFSCECSFTRHFPRVNTKAPSTQNHTKPPLTRAIHHHYPTTSPYLTATHRSYYHYHHSVTELLKHFATSLLSRSDNR